MTYNIESELDRLMDEHDAKTARAETRGRIARGVFEARRDRVDLAKATPLKRRRLTFRDVGLSVPELADRAAVAESTIRALESGESGSDLTWTRLARALAEPGEQTGRVRQVIDPNFIHG
jgi:hypothetical protein